MRFKANIHRTQFYAFESLCVWALLSLSLTDTHPAPALPPLSGSSLVAFLTEAMLAGLTTASHRPTTAADFVSLGLTTARLLIFLSLPALGFFYQGTTNTGDEESQALIGPLEAASSDYGSIYRQEIVLAQEEGRNFMDFVQTLVAEDSEEDSEEDSLV